MLIVKNIFDLLQKHVRDFWRSGLQTRFLFRVLLPPFSILLIVSIVAYVTVSEIVRSSEIDSLRRAADTTASKLESESELRKKVLVGVGNEIFKIRDKNSSARKSLDTNYTACRTFINTSSDFTKSPNDVCQPFYAAFASAMKNGTSLVTALNNSYKSTANNLSDPATSSVNDQLKTFKTFFGEATQLIAVNKDGKLISYVQDDKNGSKEYLDRLTSIAKQAESKPIEGLYEKNADMRQIIFAYPLDEGVILASYNLDSSSYFYQSWKNAPIDGTKAYVVIVDTASKQTYPKVKDEGLYMPVINSHDKSRTDFSSSNVNYLAASEPVGDTGWRVIVASPAAYALAPLANSQIIAVLVIGGLLVVFLWTGSRFIHRTVDSILTLVSGAVMFSNNTLTHRIDTEHMSDKEFAQLADVMNNMAAKIQEAEKAIEQKDKEFISVATHEIKAPMTAIIGNLSMILEDGMGAMDPTAKELADQAYQGTIRLRDLVGELLDIARLESGSAKFNLVPVDLVKEVGAMVQLQKTPATESNIRVKHPSNTQPVMVIADKTKLDIVLTNFISNGIKYNRAGGELAISYQVNGNLVTVSVQDTGLGIPKEQQDKMFQKFFRVEAEDRAGIPGTGLGMYITKQFIEGMGGRLWFESEHGKGTVFHFTLPLASDAEPSKKPQQELRIEELDRAAAVQ